jgi:GntR family transcriptional repressor for pyruvate dehydrogenase complex
MPPLAPLAPRPSATSAAEHALRRAILDGSLVPGDKLPPERELAAQLGVSRLTLRAALATLSATGMLAVRHGSGYVVRDFQRSGGSDLLVGLVELAETRGELAIAAADLLRLRRHLAAAVLDALAERPPAPAARRAVSAAVDAFAAAIERGVDAIADADLAIVGALLDATGSAVLKVSLNPVASVVRGCAPLRETLYAEPAGNLAGWRALLVWLERPTASTIPVLLDTLARRDRATVARLGKGRGRSR